MCCNSLAVLTTIIGAEAAVTFTNSTSGPMPVHATYSAEYMVECDSVPLVWSTARAACAAKGDGWALATVPSQVAQDIIADLLTLQRIFLAGSDAAVANRWMWVEGRLGKLGVPFYEGMANWTSLTCEIPPCASPPGQYHHFPSYQPDNANNLTANVETVVEIFQFPYKPDRGWNDTPDTSLRSCYACERSLCTLAADCNVTNTLSVNTSKYVSMKDHPSGTGGHCGCVCRDGFSGPRCDDPMATVVVSLPPSAPLGNNVSYRSEFRVECSAQSVTWTEARDACRASVGGGGSGGISAGWDIATVPSDVAQGAMGNFTTDRLWLGASDAATEGTWVWQSGRLKGQTFYRGARSGTTCVVPPCACEPGMYCHFSPSEPNNALNIQEEDYLNTFPVWATPLTPHLWNDSPHSDSSVFCYACERSFCSLTADCNATNTLSVNTSKIWVADEPCGCVCKGGFSGPRCDDRASHSPSQSPSQQSPSISLIADITSSATPSAAETATGRSTPSVGGGSRSRTPFEVASSSPTHTEKWPLTLSNTVMATPSLLPPPSTTAPPTSTTTTTETTSTTTPETTATTTTSQAATTTTTNPTATTAGVTATTTPTTTTATPGETTTATTIVAPTTSSPAVACNVHVSAVLVLRPAAADGTHTEAATVTFALPPLTSASSSSSLPMVLAWAPVAANGSSGGLSTDGGGLLASAFVTHAAPHTSCRRDITSPQEGAAGGGTGSVSMLRCALPPFALPPTLVAGSSTNNNTAFGGPVTAVLTATIPAAAASTGAAASCPQTIVSLTLVLPPSAGNGGGDGTDSASITVIVLTTGAVATTAYALLCEPWAVEPLVLVGVLDGPCAPKAVQDTARIAIFALNPFAALDSPALAGALLIAVVALVVMANATAAAVIASRRGEDAEHTAHTTANPTKPTWRSPVGRALFPRVSFAVAVAALPGVAWALAAAIRHGPSGVAAPTIICVCACVLYVVAVPSVGALVVMRLAPARFVPRRVAPSEAWWRRVLWPSGRWITSTGSNSNSKENTGDVPAAINLRGLTGGPRGGELLFVGSSLLATAVFAITVAPPASHSCATRHYSAAGLFLWAAVLVAFLRPHRAPLTSGLTAVVMVLAAASTAAVGASTSSSNNNNSSAAARHAPSAGLATAAVVLSLLRSLHALATANKDGGRHHHHHSYNEEGRDGTFEHAQQQELALTVAEPNNGTGDNF